MKVKLKNVFVIYFLVSVIGLMYALLQLGECWAERNSCGAGAELRAGLWARPGAVLDPHQSTVPTVTGP